MYDVNVDGKDRRIEAASLAAVANIVRQMLPKTRVQIWSPSGLLLVDTDYGDAYNLVQA